MEFDFSIVIRDDLQLLGIGGSGWLGRTFDGSGRLGIALFFFFAPSPAFASADLASAAFASVAFASAAGATAAYAATTCGLPRLVRKPLGLPPSCWAIAWLTSRHWPGQGEVAWTNRNDQTNKVPRQSCWGIVIAFQRIRDLVRALFHVGHRCANPPFFQRITSHGFTTTHDPPATSH